MVEAATAAAAAAASATVPAAAATAPATATSDGTAVPPDVSMAATEGGLVCSFCTTKVCHSHPFGAICLTFFTLSGSDVTGGGPSVRPIIFRMKRAGVPVAAIQAKMRLVNKSLDPSLIGE